MECYRLILKTVINLNKDLHVLSFPYQIRMVIYPFDYRGGLITSETRGL